MDLIVLSRQEQQELAALESTIQRNLSSFYEIGIALMTIRDKRLYRDGFDTFEHYCRERWQFARNYANKLIASSQVIENLNKGTIVPKTESQARPLTKLEPEQQKEVWEKAVQTAPEGKITARHVQKIVNEAMETKRPEPETSTYNRVEAQPVSDAMVFAGMAISQLERIRSDDPKRIQALDRVAQWIQKNR
jgi:hypothetical protein